jgi:hypothetical protein
MKVGNRIMRATVALWLVARSFDCAGSSAKSIESVNTSDFQSDVMAFSTRNSLLYLGAISSVNPPPIEFLAYHNG